MALGQHLSRLSIVIGLSIVVQAWVVLHAVVPAQDSVRYLAMAQTMERDGWWSALVIANDPPLYPTLVYAVEVLLSRSWLAYFVPERLVWLRSLQLAAAGALVASLVPLYAMLLRWAGARAALFGCVLFSVLGSTARLGADGLSDSVQLLAALSVLCGLTLFVAHDTEESNRLSPHGRRNFALALLCGAGVALGIGMLGGSVAVALLPAALIALLTERADANGDPVKFGRCTTYVITASLGVAAVLMPYWTLTAGFDSGALQSRIRADHRPEAAALLNVGFSTDSVGTGRAQAAADGQVSTWRLADGQPMAFGHKESSRSSRTRGLLPAIGQFARELAMLVGLPVGALALFGLFLAPQSNSVRIDRFFVRLALVYSLVVIAHAARAGYLSERHLLPLVPLVLCWGARGAIALGVAVQRGLPWSAQWADTWPRVPAAAWFARLTMAAVALVSAAQLIAPLHTSRWGHRQAAEWLAARATAGGAVLDTRGWTALYSGRPTYRHEAAPAALANSRLAYVVVESRELDLDSPRSRTLRELLSRSAQQVVRFSAEGEAAGQGVVIYRWDPERFAALSGVRDVRE